MSQSVRGVVEDTNGIVGYATGVRGNGANPAPPSQWVERLRVLWEQRRFLLRVTSAAAVIAVLGTLLIPNRYESTARIMPPEKESSGMGAAVLNALVSKATPNSSLGTMAGDMLGV